MSSLRLGYVLKRYPRYSETFVVNEILAHEAAGAEIDIFSLRHHADQHFQDVISRVRAPVHYLHSAEIKGSTLWRALGSARAATPGFRAALDAALDEDVSDVYQALELAEHVRAKGISHLHAHFGTSAATVARLAAALAGIGYTFTAHAKDIFHESVDHDDLRRKMEDACAVVTVSDYNLAYLRDRWGGSAGGVVRVYNGLELDRFPYSEPSNRRPVILAVGRLVEKKGFLYLVDACRELVDRGVEFSCRIIGTGPEHAALSQRIAALQLEDRVQLTGARPQAEVIDELRNAAVFAAPCVLGSDGNRDGLPTVLLESMALGTPCVSTDVTGIPEVLRDGETGLLVGQHDASALADACATLLADAPLRVHLAEAARKLIESEFDVHRNAAHIRGIFESAALRPAMAVGVR